VRGVLQESGLLEELQTAEATAVTDSTGAYVLQFLAPGTYEVSVDSTDADPQSVDVGEGEAVTGIDFVIN